MLDLRVFVIYFLVTQTKVNSQNNSNSVLISTYSKVAKWGANLAQNSSAETSNPNGEGRSSGQSLWTHRSDANVISGQNLKNKKPLIVYSYGPSKPSSKVDKEKVQEVLPARGEIQERFNPRPYFEYSHRPPKGVSGQSSKIDVSSSPSDNDKPPSIMYGVPFQPSSNSPPQDYGGSPFDSFPIFTKSEDDDSKPPMDSEDSYNSPYSSYNPPKKSEGGDDSKNDDDGGYNYPPLGSAPSDDSDDYGPPQDDNHNNNNNHNNGNGGGHDNGKPASSDSYDNMPPVNGYLPPAEPSPPGPEPQDDDSYSSYNNPPDVHPKGNHHMDSDKFPGPYAYLPSYNSDPHPSHGQHHDSSMAMMSMPPSKAHGDDSSYAGPPITYTVPPPNYDHVAHAPPGAGGGDYDDHQYFHHVATPAPPPPPAAPMGEDDLSPPMPGDAAHFGHDIPQYLDHDPKDHGYEAYGGYDHHHPPVYHEVEHPTTTEAMEDQRVNKGHYSYYYLGRKLWYIPLYFSIYFIIYVTVLILKSIARHKVQFKHHFDNKYRKSRNMEIDDLHSSVTKAVEDVEQKYM